MGKHIKRHRIPTTFANGFAIREVRPQYWLVDFMVDGRRVRKTFTDLNLAKAFCQEKRREIASRGSQSLDLPDAIRVHALKAMEILKGTGATIVQAAEEYARRHPKTQGEAVRQTCDRYLARMTEEGRRMASIRDKRWKFGAICEDLGDRQTASLDQSDISQWITARGFKNGTAHAYEGAAKTLLAFFRGEKRRAIRNCDEAAPETWDVKTATTLFQNAETFTPDLVPALAVLFFAGIRPTEMVRLTWEQIDLDGRVIRLTGDVTKTRTMRNVEISDNLLAWLSACQGAGPLVKSGAWYRTQRERLMKKSNITSWPTDVARHTFATMLYNSTHDAAKVMAQLGHFGNPQTFVTHYKGVPVTAADAAAYWQINPTKTHTAKVMRFVAAS
jgi:integrase